MIMKAPCLTDDNIKVVFDSIHARNFLRNYLDTEFEEQKSCTYLVIDLNKKTWRTSFDFEWLYCDKPLLTSLVEIGNILEPIKGTNNLC